MHSILKKQVAFNDFLLRNSQDTIEKMESYEQILRDTNGFIYGGENPSVTATPFVLLDKDLDRLARCSEELFHLIVSLPDRIFHGNLIDYARALRVPANRLPLYSKTFGDNRNLFGRADVLLSNEGWRFVELNVSGVLGGIDIGLANRLATKLGYFEGFCHRDGLSYLDPAEAMISILRSAVADSCQGSKASIAIMEWSRWIPEIRDHYECLCKILADPAFEIFACDESQLRIQDGRLIQDKKPVHVVLRSFQSFDDEFALKTMAEYMELHRQNTLKCLVPSHVELFMSKANFALLWNPTYRKYFTAREREFIETYIPETQLFNDTEFAKTHRSEFIVKAADSWGGEGVFPGWEYSADEWEHLLGSLPAQGTYVAQRRVSVLPIEMPTLEAGMLKMRPFNVVWGPIMINSSYAGMFTRSLTVEKGSVVNGAKGAALGAVFSLR